MDISNKIVCKTICKISIAILFIIITYTILYSCYKFIYAFSVKINENYGPNNSKINIDNIKTNESILFTIRNMLKDVNILFGNAHITYWMDGGTLLGAVRHKDVIPWDDDADLAILDKDENKLLSLQPELYKMGYGLTSFWGGYKIYPLNGINIKYYNRNWKWGEQSKDIEENETFNYKYPFIDIFFVNKEKNQYQFSNDKVKRTWPNYYHNEMDLFPLKKYKFNNFELMGPNNPIPYLDRSYGKDWKTTGYRQYDHENQKMLDKKKFNLDDLK